MIGGLGKRLKREAPGEGAGWIHQLGGCCHGPTETMMFWARAVAVGWRGDRTELTGLIGPVPGNSSCSTECLLSE